MPKTISPNYPTPFEPLVLHAPQSATIPLLGDSPHNGVKYPKDFNFSIPFDLLRAGEDTDVDALWQAIPLAGGTLLAAEFPRSYIDPNRNADDIDIAMLSAPWPQQARPTVKSKLGSGLIWKTASMGDEEIPVYNRLLTPAEVKARIDNYHAPYHTALQEQVKKLYQQFGAIWHLNLHSMPTTAYKSLGIGGEHTLADFVLGNLDGSTCSAEFTDLVAKSLRNKGYSVAINNPYKGVAIIANIGNPAQNRHSMQVEIHRKLYMNEVSRERNAHFNTLQADLTKLTAEIAAYIQTQLKS